MANAPSEVKREHRINLRVSDAVYKRLELQSYRMGLGVATLASVAVSDYLDLKLRQQEQMQLIAEAAAGAFKEAINDPESIAAMTKALGAFDGDQNRLQGV